MAPIQHLGEYRQEKTGLSTGCFRFLFFPELFGRSDLIRNTGIHYLKGSERDQLGFPDTSTPRGHDLGGIFPAIVGTLYLVIGSSLISFPIGIMSGIYMNEYASNGKLIRFIRIMTNNLSGVPSVVFGLFGMSLFVSTLGWGRLYYSGFVYLGANVLATYHPYDGRGFEKYR